MSETKKSPDVEKIFSALDAALCLRARASGEQPAKQYFWHSTPNVAKLLLDGGIFQIVLTPADEEDRPKPAESK